MLYNPSLGIGPLRHLDVGRPIVENAAMVRPDEIPCKGDKIMTRRAISMSIVLIGCLAMVRVAQGQDRATKVLKDREQVLEQGSWVYNDLAAGIAEAKKTGKPLLVVLRCIP